MSGAHRQRSFSWRLGSFVSRAGTCLRCILLSTTRTSLPACGTIMLLRRLAQEQNGPALRGCRCFGREVTWGRPAWLLLDTCLVFAKVKRFLVRRDTVVDGVVWR
ncbi:unnamed protein product [Ectocarpus sp. 13 AM-2016]